MGKKENLNEGYLSVIDDERKIEKIELDDIKKSQYEMLRNPNFFNDVKIKEEENDGDTITETAGYRNAKQIVRDLKRAGIRNAEYIKEQYHYPDGIPIDEDMYVLPQQRKDFDLVDQMEEEIRLAKILKQTQKLKNEALVKYNEEQQKRQERLMAAMELAEKHEAEIQQKIQKAMGRDKES